LGVACRRLAGSVWIWMLFGLYLKVRLIQWTAT